MCISRFQILCKWAESFGVFCWASKASYVVCGVVFGSVNCGNHENRLIKFWSGHHAMRQQNIKENIETFTAMEKQIGMDKLDRLSNQETAWRVLLRKWLQMKPTSQLWAVNFREQRRNLKLSEARTRKCRIQWKRWPQQRQFDSKRQKKNWKHCWELKSIAEPAN